MPDAVTLRFTANGTSFSPPLGRTDTLVKNADGTFTLTIEHTHASHLQFGTDGTLTSATDDWGNTLNYTYDSNGRIQTIADASGSTRSLTVTWNASGRIDSLTDSASRVVKYSYATDGTLVHAADPVASAAGAWSANYSYTAGRYAPVLAGITDRWNRTITALEWDSSYRLHSYTDGPYTTGDQSGEKYTYTYFPSANPAHTTKTNSIGSTDYTYTSSGLVNSTDTFTPSGNLLSSTDTYGTAQYAYDGSGNLLTVTKGGVTWSFTYDPNLPEHVSTIISSDPSHWPGWKYVWNANGSLQSVKRYRSDNTTLDTWLAFSPYDAHGHPTVVQDENGDVYSYTFNSVGDMIASSSGGVSYTYENDSLGRVTKITDASGHYTTYAYDSNDRITTITLPSPSAGVAGFVTTYTYDQYDAATGLVFTTITDPNNRQTTQGYDALGHVCKSTDAAGNATLYTYQYALLKTITDANGNSTQYEYDANRNLKKTTFPDGAVETYSAGVDGVPVSRTDRRGTTTTWQYDPFGRPTQVSYGAGSGMSFTYAGQNLITISDSLRGYSTSLTYDSLFRLQTEQESTLETITYNYSTLYPGDRIYGYTVTPPAGSPGPTQVTYGFDSYNRVNAVNWTVPQNPTNIFTIDYTPTGQYLKITYPTGQSRSFTYDGMDRLLTVVNRHPTTGDIADFTYGYDENWGTTQGTFRGQRTSVTVNAVPQANQMNGTTKYQYDSNYQLTRADYPIGYGSWTYDAIGNRMSETMYTGTGNPSTFGYSYYNNGLRLASTGTGSTFLYDANGNLTGARFQTANVWDAANRMTFEGSSGTTYSYDFRDRRASAAVGSAVTRYIRVGYHTVGSRTATPGTSFDYVFAPGIDEPLAKVAYGTSSNVISYYGVDGQGSVVTVSDVNGAVTGGIQYNPWGVPSTTSELFGYTGRETAANGYWQNRARYYQAATGRFISEDPLQEYVALTGSDTYRYATNSPILYDDPFGLLCRTQVFRGEPDMYRSRVWRTAWEQEGSSRMPGSMGVRNPNRPIGVGSPFNVNECLWTQLIMMTEYWRQRIVTVTRCQCPDSVSRSSHFATWQSDRILRRRSALTQSNTFLFLAVPCPRPELIGYRGAGEGE